MYVNIVVKVRIYLIGPSSMINFSNKIVTQKTETFHPIFFECGSVVFLVMLSRGNSSEKLTRSLTRGGRVEPLVCSALCDSLFSSSTSS